MGESGQGYWVCSREPTQQEAEAMLRVAPETYDWRVPDTTATRHHSASVDLAAPEGHSWN